MGTRELLPGQGPFRFLIMAASAHTSGGTSRWLRAALWPEGSWSMAGAGPSEGPERGGQGGGGSASLHLSSHPLLHCYLMGQREGGEGRKPQGLPQVSLPASPQKRGRSHSLPPSCGGGWAGWQPALLRWVDFSSMLPCYARHTHSAFSQGARGEAEVNPGEAGRQSCDPGRMRLRKRTPGAKKKF